MNPRLDLHNHAQSVWLDYIRRDLLASAIVLGEEQEPCGSGWRTDVCDSWR